MMTPNEAWERARKIWGDQVQGVEHKDWNPGTWLVVLYNGGWHDLDGNGHVTCHQECAEVEEALP